MIRCAFADIALGVELTRDDIRAELRRLEETRQKRRTRREDTEVDVDARDTPDMQQRRAFALAVEMLKA